MDTLQKAPPRLSHILLGLAAIFLFIAACRVISGGINRPIEQDELVTLKYYTSMPYDFNAADDAGQARGSVVLLLRGWLKCFLNPWNPNGHTVNSILTSASAFLFGFHEWAFRIPAMAGLLLMLTLLFVYASRRIGVGCALILMLLVSTHPHLVYYSMSCRGYTLTALLVLCSIACTNRFLARPTHFWGGVMGICHVIMFLNLGSMLFTWILPVTLAASLALLRREPKAESLPDLASRLGPLFWISIGTFASISMYIAGALHYFFQAQTHYGLKFKNISGLLSGLYEVCGGLCPNLAWTLFFIVGLAGLVRMFWSERRWIAQAFFFSVAISLLYAIVTHKLFYPRTFGYYIPLTAIGCVELWALIGDSPALARIVRLFMAAVILPALCLETREALRFGANREVTYSDLAAQIRREARSLNGPGLIELPWMYGDEMPAYLPSDHKWFTLTPDLIGKTVTVYLPCELRGGKVYFRTQTRDRAASEFDYWEVPLHWETPHWYKGAAVDRVKMIAHGGFDTLPGDATEAIVVWIQKEPFFNLPTYIKQGLASKKDPWTIEGNGIVFGALHLFSKSKADLACARTIISDLQRRTQGDVYVLVPK